MKKLLTLLAVPLLLLSSCNKTPVEESSAPVISSKIEVEPAETYTKENHTLYKGEQKIVGELYLPNNDLDFFSLLIVSHGFNNNMDNTRNDAIEFVKLGFATFIFDFIGGGSSIKSDGKMTEMSVLTEAEDLNVVIEYLIELDEIDENNIFLMGQSQGGFVSTYVACTRDDIKGLINFYPAYVIRDDAIKAYATEDLVPDTYTVMGYITVGKIYWQDATSFDIYDLMPDYDKDVLIIHGTADSIVPYEYAVRASETFPSAELMTIQGADHGFSGQNRTNALDKSKEYLLEHL